MESLNQLSKLYNYKEFKTPNLKDELLKVEINIISIKLSLRLIPMRNKSMAKLNTILNKIYNANLKMIFYESLQT